jgi:hypothetical protein
MALEKAGAQIQAIGLAEYPNQQRRAGKHCKLLGYPVFDGRVSWKSVRKNFYKGSHLSPGVRCLAKGYDTAPIAWTWSRTRRLRLNDGVLKSTSECSSGNVNQSLKKASLTQGHLEFQLWQIESRIVVVGVVRRSDPRLC